MDPPILYDFCRAVTDQLRCRAEADGVYEELYGHVQDHVETLTGRGMAEEEAQRAAVAAMGDPVELGKALDKLHSPWPWRVLRFCTTGLGLALAALLLFGTAWFFQPAYEKGPPLFTSLTAEEIRAALPCGECEPLRTGAVRGGGRVGDYFLSPAGEALLFRLEPYAYEGEWRPPEYLLVFAVRTFHWQPWLDDLQSSSLTPSSSGDLDFDPAGGAINTVMWSLEEGGRLTGLHAVVVSGVAETARQITVTLSTDRGTVRFTVELGEEEAP